MRRCVHTAVLQCHTRAIDCHLGTAVLEYDTTDTSKMFEQYEAAAGGTNTCHVVAGSAARRRGVVRFKYSSKCISRSVSSAALLAAVFQVQLY